MTQTVIALDVGGTGIKCALVGADGDTRHTVLHSERHATGRERGSDAVVATILDIAEGLAATARAKGLDPRAAGVAVPGVIDERNGVAVWAANVGFRDVPLKALLEERLGLPAALGHDVRAGGLAEARLGAGRDHSYVLVIPIGTGIAAANVVNGQVYTGAHGAAGEIGHIVVRPDGPMCGCGQRGCLEAIASASAVGRRYGEQAGRPATAEEVARLAAEGEPVAVAVWQETVDALADGLMTGIALFDPAVIVLGGGLAEAGEALLAPLRAGVHARVTFHREPTITRAALGDEAGCLGAALLALDSLHALDSPHDNSTGGTR
ncbi:ROK family protein [Dactylosporangium sp. NBC_01737]|uniref:ROK family protein n=1 Tax=Dactylosporangium sp. NBC_01737 TaxID=2975959 RepID=UPI002E13E4A6|nr:ROK family protein [Dactylosporangium sp. NBC_01737]